MFLNSRISVVNEVAIDSINFVNLPKVNALQTEVKFLDGFSSSDLHLA